MEPTHLKLHVEILPFLNVALYLNDIPFIRNIVLENTDETDSGTLTIRISCDIPFFDAFDYAISCIPTGKEVNIPLTGLTINRQFLATLTENERAKVKIELIEGEQVIRTEEHTVSVYPMEYFGGFSILPELVAAYVTPNHPYVYHRSEEHTSELQS